MAKKKPPEPSVADKPLTDRQKRFVAEYLIDLNATAAYTRAYGTKNEKAARAAAARLLANVSVKVAVEAGQKRVTEKAELRAERVLQEQCAIAFSDPADVFDFTGDKLRLRKPKDIPEQARRAISSIKVKPLGRGKGQAVEVRFWPKGNAVEMLGRMFNLFPARLEHTGKDGKPIKSESTVKLDLTKLTDEQLDQYRTLLAALCAGGQGGA